MAEGALGRFPVLVEIPVAWGDMDALGHVNNTLFLRWCETARIAYLERMVQGHRPGNLATILARAVVDFRQPVTFPDTVQAHVSVTRIGRTSLTMAYRLTSRAKGTVVAEAESVVVLFDYGKGEKAPITEEMRRRIYELEESGPSDQ